MRKINLLLFSILLFSSGAYAQSIKRHVIASFGLPHTQSATGVACTAVTVGQPPNAGGLSNSTYCLRQGFQQPNNENCGIMISLEVTETTLSGCGTYYSFEYTGDLNPNTTINWQFGSNATITIAEGAMPPLVGFFEIGSQEITITVSDGTCQKTAKQFITSTGTPFGATTSATNALCYGDKGAITLTVQNGTSPISYEWSNGASTKDLLDVIPGDYSFTVTDAKGCTSIGTETVEGAAQPVVFQAKVLDELCTDTKDGSIEITINNAALPLTYLWSDGSNQKNRTALTTGLYDLNIKDANGCQLDTSFNIRTFCLLNEEDFIPDVFSPNGDGKNDTWVIDMLDRFPDSATRIFNRWGNIVWESENPFSSWDGRNTDGELLPIGAYFYVIELNDTTKKFFKGSVTIIR